MGRGKSADVDGVINAAEGIYLSVSGETDKKQEDKLKNMIRKAEELKDKLQKSRDDLNVSLRGQVISLEEGVEELCQDIKDELDEDRKRNSCLKAIPAIRNFSSVCGPLLSIFGVQYFSMSNISGFIVCFLGLSLIFPRFSFLTEFLKMWNGGVEKRLKELAPRLKAYEERLKEIQETRQRVREANTFDVGPILRGFPDAKKFWIDQFGADKRKVPTTRFIEVLLDWRNKMDVSRGVRVEPLPEKERETLYCQVGKVIDTNHDGSVSPTELANILAYFGPLHHSVIKMRSLVDFDDDGEPRRQPWFIWKDVGKDQFTKKLEEAKYSCFVVRASESVRNAFVVQRRIFKLNEEQPELEKTLVLNSQAEMWEWGQEELLQWGLDRLYLEQYKPGPAKSEQKCGPKRFDMKRKDSLKRVIKSYLLNNIKQLINLGVEGPDWARVSVKNVWDLATQEGLHELSTKDKQGTKQDQKDLKSVVNELKKTNKRKKSLRVTDFRIAFTPEVWKKEFTSIDKDVEELLKELKGLQVPPDAKEFRESVREIQREIKDVVEYRQKYYPSEGGEIKETSCDELIKYKQADEKESPNEEEIERRESEMSLVQSNIEKLKVKSQLLTQTIRVKSKTKEILKNLKPLTEDKDLNKLSEAAVEASGLLKQIRWMSAEGVAAWAHDLFGGKSVFTLYLSDACSLVELKEQVEKVIRDNDFSDFNQFLRDLIQDERKDSAEEDGDVKSVIEEAKTFLIEKLDEMFKKSKDEKSQDGPAKTANAKYILVRDIKQWAQTERSLCREHRAILGEAVRKTKQPLRNRPWKDRIRDSKQGADDRYSDSVNRIIEACAGAKDKSSTRADMVKGLKDAAFLRELEKNIGIEEGGVEGFNETKFEKFESECKKLVNVEEHPSQWSIDSVVEWFAAIVRGKIYKRIVEDQKWNEESIERAVGTFRRVCNHQNIDGNKLLMLLQKEIEENFHIGDADKKDNLGWIAEEAIKFLRMDLRQGYHLKEFSLSVHRFFFPTIATMVEDLKKGVLKGYDSWIDPKTRIEFSVRGKSQFAELEMFLKKRARPCKISRDVIKHEPRIIQDRLYYNHDRAAFRAVLRWLQYKAWLIPENKVSPKLVREVAMDLLADTSIERKDYNVNDIVIVAKDVTAKPEIARWSAVYRVMSKAGDLYTLREVTATVCDGPSDGKVNIVRARSTPSCDEQYEYQDLKDSNDIEVPKRCLARYHEVIFNEIKSLEDGTWRPCPLQSSQSSSQSRPKPKLGNGIHRASVIKRQPTGYEPISNAGVLDVGSGDGVLEDSGDEVLDSGDEVLDCGDEVLDSGDDASVIDSDGDGASVESAPFKPGDNCEYKSQSRNKWFRVSVVDVQGMEVTVRLASGAERQGTFPSSIRAIAPQVEDLESVEDFSAEEDGDGNAANGDGEGASGEVSQEGQAPQSAPASARKPYEKGSKVQYLSKTQLQWYPATVDSVSSDGKIVTVLVRGKTREATLKCVRWPESSDTDNSFPKAAEKAPYRRIRQQYSKLDKSSMDDRALSTQSSKYTAGENLGLSSVVMPAVATPSENPLGAQGGPRAAADGKQPLAYGTVSRLVTMGALSEESAPEKTVTEAPGKTKSKYTTLSSTDMIAAAGAGDGKAVEKVVSKYTFVRSEDFQGTVDGKASLLDKTGCWYPNLGREQARMKIENACRSNPNVSIFLFRKSSQRLSDPNTQVFALTSFNLSKSTIQHYLLYQHGSDEIKVAPGPIVPKSLETYQTLSDLIQFVKTKFEWGRNAIPLTKRG